jgi:regulator of protease activity HflC (stomatin/prohibitin superfamily)
MEGNDSNRQKVKLYWLFIVFVLVFAILPYFLEDAFGFSYKVSGTYFWLIAFGASFLAAIFYFSQFLLPLPWQVSWYEGVRLTIRHNFPFFIDIARWLFARPENVGVTPEAIKDLPPNFTKHQAGIISSHQTPIIFLGSSFARGAKPGFLRLRHFERVVQVIDLRRHLRRMPVRVLTRDGITLETGVSVIFQVQRMADPPDDKWQFPFDQDAIFKVSYLGYFKMENDMVLPWADRVPRQAVSALIYEVSRYSLDELFQPDESRALPLEKIKEKIGKQMKKAFEKYGVEIISVGVSPFQVPDIVREQRIANWKAIWEQRTTVAKESAQAERTRRLKLARARAQIEIIQRLAEGIEAVNQAGEDITDIIVLRLIETVEEAESNAAVKALIPAQVVNDLELIRSQVLEGED